MRHLSLVALASLAFGCSSKTYLSLTLDGTPASTITSVDVDLAFGTRTATTTLSEKGGAPITLPTTVTFELQTGSGPLTVVAKAKSGAQEVARGSKSLVITRGKTTHETITFDTIAMGDLSVGADLTATSVDLTEVVARDMTSDVVVLAFDDDDFDFGNVEQGMASAPKTFSLTNTGAAAGTLTTALTGGSAARFAISNDTCAGTPLAPSASCTLDVVFTPSGIGDVTGVTLDVTALGGGSDSITLAGHGVAPGDVAITGDPNFGIADVATNVIHDLTVTNNGGVAIGPLVVSSTNAQFAPAQTGMTCVGATLDPGNTCTQRMTFTPTTYGGKTSMLSIGKSGGPTATANLTGTGRDQVAITASTNGTGSGTITGSGLNCGNGNTVCTVQITRTTTAPSVTLAASANNVTSTFATWGGACSASGATVTCNLSMTAAQTVSATFNTATAVGLTVTKTAILTASGTITTPDSRINCGGTCSTTYAQSASNMITLTATPGSGFIVVWGGDCASAASNATCTISMAAARTVKAKFRRPVNVAFVSSGTFPSNMSTTVHGVPGGDANCQAAATAADLPGTYKAYLSSDTVNGASHLRAFNVNVRGWVRLDNVTFADTLDTLNSNGPTNAVNRDELNNAPDPNFFGFWSGHYSNGAAGNGYTCAGWTVQTGGEFSGNWTITGTNWQAYFNITNGCEPGSSHLVCMGVDYSNAP